MRADVPVQLSLEMVEIMVAIIWNDATPEEIQTLSAIAMAESAGVVNAIGDNFASGHQSEDSPYRWDDGLLQINSIHEQPREKLQSSPMFNIAAAIQIHATQGFGAWVAFKRGRHLQFMGDLSSGIIATILEHSMVANEASPPINPIPGRDARVIPLRKEAGRQRFLVEVYDTV